MKLPKNNKNVCIHNTHECDTIYRMWLITLVFVYIYANEKILLLPIAIASVARLDDFCVFGNKKIAHFNFQGLFLYFTFELYQQLFFSSQILYIHTDFFCRKLKMTEFHDDDQYVFMCWLCFVNVLLILVKKRRPELFLTHFSLNV